MVLVFSFGSAGLASRKENATIVATITYVVDILALHVLRHVFALLRWLSGRVYITACCIGVPPLTTKTYPSPMTRYVRAAAYTVSYSWLVTQVQLTATAITDNYICRLSSSSFQKPYRLATYCCTYADKQTPVNGIWQCDLCMNEIHKGGYTKLLIHDEFMIFMHTKRRNLEVRWGIYIFICVFSWMF